MRSRAVLVVFALVATAGCSLQGFGDPSRGGLGVGPTSESRIPPTVIGAPSSWIQASTGTMGGCGIALDGALYCWGLNGEGQVGDGTTVDRLVPTRIGSATWKQVSVGGGFSCGIQSDDSLWCWGWVIGGVPGIGAARVPTRVDDAKWASVSAGEIDHACGIRLTGSLWCWGRNANLQLGDPTFDDHASPYHVGSATWKAVVAGNEVTCAIRSDGELWCWGATEAGVFTPTDGSVSYPPTVILDDVAWSSVDLGLFHACGIRADASLWCWGASNSFGELGDGAGADHFAPHRVGAASWRWVATGDYHSCGVQVDKTLWCWGWNGMGQLGVPGDVDQLAPVKVGSATNWLTVSAGSVHTIATSSPI